MSERTCSKATCSKAAVATLTFDYQASIAVIGQLSPSSQDAAFDLCREHAQRFTPPQNWQLIKHLSLSEK
ncbi:MAG: DUF3499 family protein [Micrococcales bacterium]